MGRLTAETVVPFDRGASCTCAGAKMANLTTNGPVGPTLKDSS